jgi:hypothetical protein
MFLQHIFPFIIMYHLSLTNRSWALSVWSAWLACLATTPFYSQAEPEYFVTRHVYAVPDFGLLPEQHRLFLKQVECCKSGTYLMAVY